MLKMIFLFGLILCSFVMTNAQTKEDSLQIIQTGLNYLEGWYTADTVRMDRALHDSLIKRRVIFSQDVYKLSEMTKLQMMEKTKVHKIVPLNEQGIRITILDVFGTIASVKAESKGFYDYLHMVKTNGQWQIINALWDKKVLK